MNYVNSAIAQLSTVSLYSPLSIFLRSILLGD